MREVCRNGRSYLPLEAFRPGGGRVDALGETAFRTFRSSGTTSDTRSLSRFSEEGLAAYRAGSLTAFLAMLKKAAVGAVEITRGVSLIPRVEEWPDSSLAQMVAWIGDVMTVEYATAATLADEIREAGEQPVFVFGTAFHFVHLIDAGFTTKLPEGSVVIETGGTKGKAREIGREDLHAELARIFGVGEDRIVSEYGMCELASQAYGREKFRFPNWVKVGVLTGPRKVEASGRGALVVDDPQRLDVGLPVRTEDLVELSEDGSFTLLGRLESAPLKGCSLLVGDIFQGTSPSLARGFSMTGSPSPSCAAKKIKGSEERAREFLEFFDGFLANPLAHKALTREFGSEAAATAALEDLAVSAPGTVEEWIQATPERETAEHWLVILPENHSLVGIYPLALGYVLGLDLTVRVPRKFEEKTSFLQTFIEAITQLPGAKVATVPATFRLGDSRFPAGRCAPLGMTSAHSDLLGMTIDGVLIYGSDETVRVVEALLPGRLVQGFGSQVGWTVCERTEIPLLVRDAFGLAQRGCMSTRVAVIAADAAYDENQIAAEIAAAAISFWDAPLDWRLAVGMDGAALQLEGAGFRVHERTSQDSPLVATRHLTSLAELTPELLRGAVSRHPFVLPVLVTNDPATALFVKTPTAEVSLTKSRYPGLSFREVGTANRPVWDGSHEMRTLFPHY